MAYMIEEDGSITYSKSQEVAVPAPRGQQEAALHGGQGVRGLLCESNSDYFSALLKSSIQFSHPYLVQINV